MILISSEEQVTRDLEAMGLRGKLSAEDFALSVKDEIRARELRGSTAQDFHRPSETLTRPSGVKTPPVTPPQPVRSYDCEACHDEQTVLTGTRRHDQGGRVIRTNPIPCPRCVPLSERARKSGIEEMFIGARLAALTKRTGNVAAVEFAQSWDGTSSVLLTSRTNADGETTPDGNSAYGTGKTHIACAMLIGQLEHARPGKFLYAKHFLSGIQALFGADAGAVQAYIDAVAQSPLLVLDDLGAERPSDWTREQFRTLIDDRYRRKLVTVITSNIGTIERFADLFGGAVADRLRDYTHVKVGGSSMRGVVR